MPSRSAVHQSRCGVHYSMIGQARKTPSHPSRAPEDEDLIGVILSSERYLQKSYITHRSQPSHRRQSTAIAPIDRYYTRIDQTAPSRPNLGSLHSALRRIPLFPKALNKLQTTASTDAIEERCAPKQVRLSLFYDSTSQEDTKSPK